MSTTTIRLPEDLKARVASAAKRSGKTVPGFILEASPRRPIARSAALVSTRSPNSATRTSSPRARRFRGLKCVPTSKIAWPANGRD
jgi:hypothetical protein